MSVTNEPLIPYAEGIWIAYAPVSILGMKLTSTMTVLRLGDGKLLLHSPIAMTPERRAAVESIGTVAHLYSPNLFHHLRIGEWSAAFPSARIHAPAGLEKKRPDLRIDRYHVAAPEPDFANFVQEIPIHGFRLNETVLLYQPSQTLVVTDLVHNIGRQHHGWTKFYSSMMGFYDRVALSRIIRWTGFSDKRAARRSLDALLQLPFNKIIVGHGTPVDTEGREILAQAYRWLPTET